VTFRATKKGHKPCASTLLWHTHNHHSTILVQGCMQHTDWPSDTLPLFIWERQMKPEAIRNRIEEMLQQSPFASLSSDLKLALQSQLQSLITNANLVTREEFDVQAEVLRRTSARLAELEERLAKLEAE